MNLLTLLTQNKKLLFGIVLCVIAVAWTWWLFSGGVVIHITSDDGATIYVATERGGGFKKIGTTSASYKVREIPTTVFFKATDEDEKKQTISGVEVSSDTAVELAMPLADTRAADELFSNTSLKNIHIDDTLVQGIDPSSNVLTSFRTDRYEPSRLAFIKIPFLKKVVWKDSDNFVYNSFRTGVGIFQNGKHTGVDNLAATVRHLDGTVSRDSFRGLAREGNLEFVDIALYPEKPLVLLSNNGLFVSDNLGVDIKQIVDFERDGIGLGSVFSDSNSIYRLEGEAPAEYATEGEEVARYPDDDHRHTGILYRYNYQGELLNQVPFMGEQLFGAGSNDSHAFVLSNESLMTLGGENSTVLPIYFASSGDLLVTEKHRLLLIDHGLWQISSTGDYLQLVYDFSGNGVGLSGSLALINDDQLVFGTYPTASKPHTPRKTFRVLLGD